MSKSIRLYIGMDVHQDSIAVVYVVQGHGAEVTSLGAVGTRQCDNNLKGFYSQGCPCWRRRPPGTTGKGLDFQACISPLFSYWRFKPVAESAQSAASVSSPATGPVLQRSVPQARRVLQCGRQRCPDTAPQKHAAPLETWSIPTRAQPASFPVASLQGSAT